MDSADGLKKPTVVFSRKDTLHAPNFKNYKGEHLIHTIDKQNTGAATPHTPAEEEPEEAAPARFNCLRAIFCCCRRSQPRVQRYSADRSSASSPTGGGGGGGAAAATISSPAPKADTDSKYGSLGFPPIAGKPTLVLDLDETLVHSSFKPISNPDFVIPVTIEGHVHHVYVLERPGTAEFLDRMNEHFEIICFTASLSKYANPLLDLLDPKKTIKGRLYREHCVYHMGTYVKDLSLIGRELRSTLIVDNSKNSFLFQPQCGIPCTNFIDDKSDRELYALADWLEKIADSEDMTQVTPDWCDMWEQTFNKGKQ